MISKGGAPGRIDSRPEARKRLARTGIETMRGILTAYLAFYLPGGLLSASGREPVRPRSGKTTAKTTATTA